MGTVHEYIVGSGPPPEWCRHRMMMFQQKDGSIGFEFFGYIKNYTLSRGDKLILRDGKIKISRSAKPTNESDCLQSPNVASTRHGRGMAEGREAAQ